jgi:hypothetical protein
MTSSSVDRSARIQASHTKGTATATTTSIPSLNEVLARGDENQGRPPRHRPNARVATAPSKAHVEPYALASARESSRPARAWRCTFPRRIGVQSRTSPAGDVARWLAVVFGEPTRGEDGMTNDVLGR